MFWFKSKPYLTITHQFCGHCGSPMELQEFQLWQSKRKRYDTETGVRLTASTGKRLRCINWQWDLCDSIDL